jgi:hypothetical protein
LTPEQEALLEVIRTLERLGIPYMVTGSMASSFHGRPRATHDADRARGALRHRLQFNVIETRSAFKIDLIIRKDRPFSHEELQRRQAAELSPGVSVALASPEDTILSKLEWARKAGRSERQIEDAAGVLAINPAIDREYVARWASALGVLALWREIAGDERAGR